MDDADILCACGHRQGDHLIITTRCTKRVGPIEPCPCDSFLYPKDKNGRVVIKREQG